MPGLHRDKDGICRRKDGQIAGQSWRRREPPRDISLSMRVDAPYEAKVREMMTKHKYGSLADFHQATFEAWCFLQKEGPLPHWADVGTK